MGDARTEALAAAKDALRSPYGDGLRDSMQAMLDEEGADAVIETVLDAVPASVLARLAVERGGLEPVGWLSPGMADGPNIGGLIDGKFDDDDEPVYRLTEGSTDAE